jgi:transposase
LVYALAERKLRLRLEQEDQSVPDQVGKETQTPTMRWIFQLFEGIDLLIIYQDGDVINRQVLNAPVGDPTSRTACRILLFDRFLRCGMWDIRMRITQTSLRWR